MSSSAPADRPVWPGADPLGQNVSRTPTWVLAIVLVVLLALAFFGGRTSVVTPPDALTTPVLDVEFDFAGAARTWTEDGSTADPFDGVSDAELVTIGRTACLRAGDPGMSFDGMLDVLGLSPHATYAALAEAADKLCPSQRVALTRVMEG